MNAAEAAYVEELEAKNAELLAAATEWQNRRVEWEAAVASKDQKLTEYNEQLASKDQKILELDEQLSWLKRQVFGKKSEKVLDIDADQLYFEGFAPIKQEKEEAFVKAHKRRKPQKGKDRISIPNDLPVETTTLDLEAPICPKTGVPLVKIGEDITHKLAFRPGCYFLKQTIRPKYALPNGEGIVAAPLPSGILPRCLADESFLADVFVKKFADHLPLYRIQEELARHRIGISRQLLSQWVVSVGGALAPLREMMTKEVMAGGSVFIDETPLAVQARPKVKQGYMWVLVGGGGKDPPYRTYHFRMNRKHEHAQEFLKGYQGALHSDKYGAYQNLSKQEGLQWLPCWAHIRRQFYEVESGNIEFCNWVLRKIKYLFMFERIAWKQSPEERLEIRRKHEEPILDELIEKIQKEGQRVLLPKSKYRKSVGYFIDLIPHLKNYLRCAEGHIDNNVAERAIRPLAIGRKNWLFVGSERAGEASAVLLTLVQSCRALKINPHTYLEDVMRRIMDYPANRVGELLPKPWAAERGLL